MPYSGVSQRMIGRSPTYTRTAAPRRTADTEEDRLRREYYDQMSQTRGDADRYRQQYETSRAGGDPEAAFKRTTGAAFADFKDQFTENLADLRGQQVGMGRLNTGFGFDDEDRLFTNMGKNLNRTVAGHALDVERLRQGGISRDAQVASSAADRALSATGGEYHTLRAQRMQDERDSNERRDSRRRGRWNSILGVGGATAGFLLGGPAGAAAGYQVGSNLR